MAGELMFQSGAGANQGKLLLNDPGDDLTYECCCDAPCSDCDGTQPSCIVVAAGDGDCISISGTYDYVDALFVPTNPPTTYFCQWVWRLWIDEEADESLLVQVIWDTANEVYCVLIDSLWYGAYYYIAANCDSTAPAQYGDATASLACEGGILVGEVTLIGGDPAGDPDCTGLTATVTFG